MENTTLSPEMTTAQKTQQQSELSSLVKKQNEQIREGMQNVRTVVENSPIGMAARSAVDFVQDPSFKENVINGVNRAVDVGATPLGVLAVRLGERLSNDPRVQETLAGGKEIISAGLKKTSEMIDRVRGAIPEPVQDVAHRAVETAAPVIGALRRGVTAVLDQNKAKSQERASSIGG